MNDIEYAKELMNAPDWVIYKILAAAKSEGLYIDEYLEKYNPSLDPSDWDKDAGSPEQAWA